MTEPFTYLRFNAWRGPVALGAALVMAAGCTDNTATSSGGSDSQVVKVTSTATECELSTSSVPAGTATFEVNNKGDEVTEFYLLGADGTTVKGEAENIGSGLSRKLVVLLDEGEYIARCKPGMTGEGIEQTVTVTKSDSKVDASTFVKERTAQAVREYHTYVEEQAEDLLDGTEKFAAVYAKGDVAAAKALYAPTRMYWESIEPVAEAFGDIDPRLDLREADLEAGQTWTGWHRIEKDLWPPAAPPYTALTEGERQKLADQLIADTKDLAERVEDLDFGVDQMGNGAKELLDEVVTTKITGEEEVWSHTDLWDVQANVDGARHVFDLLRPIVLQRDPELAEQITERFELAQEGLDQFKAGDGFKLYNELSEADVKSLLDSLTPLGESLAHLTAAVVG